MFIRLKHLCAAELVYLRLKTFVDAAAELALLRLKRNVFVFGGGSRFGAP